MESAAGTHHPLAPSYPRFLNHRLRPLSGTVVGVRTSLLNIPGAAVKAEAAQLGIVWSQLTGIVITSFEDGTAIFVIRSDAPHDAERLLEHLVARGLTAPPVRFPPEAAPPSDRAPSSPPA